MTNSPDNTLRPTSSEAAFLTLAYNKFYDIYDEVLSDSFSDFAEEIRFTRIRTAYQIYSELLHYPPIQLTLKYTKENRPPMEGVIGDDLFRFVRNLITHFPYFDTWNDIWINKEIALWSSKTSTIDSFLKKYEGSPPVKYRIWDYRSKTMTYINICLPTNYTKGGSVHLKDILTEKDGVAFSLVLMRKIIDVQVEKS